ncbi:hypothetical protein NBRC116494_34930 [Aurantivibrio plasticivorans]
MVTNSLKMLLVMACTLGLMVGCATTEETDMGDEGTMTDSTSGTETGTAGGTGVTVSDTEEDPAAGIDTVFYFDFDQSILKAEARSALTAHAAILKNNTDSVRLEGHADERGTREYNMALGERRANAVRDFLVLQGVERSRIETVSYGEERPAQLGSSESAWSMNRRVEMN